MENGVQSWLVNISQWNPSPEQFSFLLSVLPPHERYPINRFMKIEDRKRALVSRLLQYWLVHGVLQIPLDEIIICRTAEGKPYLQNEIRSSEYPNFNFNASHSGDYVGITSDPLYLVGMDIVSVDIPNYETITEYIESFKSYFTDLEWRNIINIGGPHEVLAEFYRYWCLKEAYVKALGTGIGHRLDRLEFQHNSWADITLCVDGAELRDWSFSLFQLDNRHWASVAKGPPWKAVSNQRALHPAKGFVLLTVEELIPISRRESFSLLCDNRISPSNTLKLGMNNLRHYT